MLLRSEAQWCDSYNVGVELIDSQHQELFAIVRKVLQLCEEEEKSRFACREGVKYFISYTQRHFAEEEAYMRKINYPDYEKHKKIHDNLCGRGLPDMAAKMEEQNYSRESVENFLKFCLNWLTHHIKVMDTAIASYARSQPVYLSI